MGVHTASVRCVPAPRALAPHGWVTLDKLPTWTLLACPVPPPPRRTERDCYWRRVKQWTGVCRKSETLETKELEIDPGLSVLECGVGGGPSHPKALSWGGGRACFPGVPRPLTARSAQHTGSLDGSIRVGTSVSLMSNPDPRPLFTEILPLLVGGELGVPRDKPPVWCHRKL